MGISRLIYRGTSAMCFSRLGRGGVCQNCRMIFISIAFIMGKRYNDSLIEYKKTCLFWRVENEKSKF
jgi:hypothetical protein